MAVGEAARCWGCDYILAGITAQRCPECGRAFDPAVPRSINSTGRPAGGLVRRVIRPPGWPLTLVSLLAFSTLWCFRVPGGFFDGQVLGGLSWLGTMAVWGLRLLVAGCVYFAMPIPDTWSPRRAWRWAVTPVVLLVYLAIPGGLIQRCAFAYARPGMERYVADLLRDPVAAGTTRSVGPFSVQFDGAIENGVRLFAGWGYDGARCGYAYVPQGEPSGKEGAYYSPVAGPWWEYADHYTAGPPPLPTTMPSIAPPSKQRKENP